MFIKLSRTLARLFAWLLKSASKDDARPALWRTITIKKGWIAACNGFSMFAANVSHLNLPEALEVGKTYCFPRLSPTSDIVEAAEMPHEYPDLIKILPKPAENDTTFFVDPAKWIDIMSGFHGKGRWGVNVVVHRDKNGNTYAPIEFFGTSDDDIPLYALLMPMHGPEKDGWRPQPEPPAATPAAPPEPAPEPEPEPSE